MLFSSFTYLLAFLPLAALVVGSARRIAGARAAQVAILLTSIVFYGWAKPSNLLLLGASVVVNWALARWMTTAPSESTKRRRILQLGLALNIAFLCTFKYVNFFLSGLVTLGLPPLGLPDWALPLGISFFTLNQIMYLVDCYEELTPPSSLFDHASFVSFYPYVVSGPLARAKNIIKQFHQPETDPAKRDDQIARGLYQFALGFSKKVFFADTFGRIADVGFAVPGDLSMVEAWAFSLAYTLQLYFDFSGYSDMAIGSARILGIEIPKNFNTPLRSRTVTEFWQRWHLSLSGFITTYLYTPILQSFKKATLRTAAIATLASMTIAGLWHGPSWNYILFGAMHGVALVINLYWKKTKRKFPFVVSWGLTIAFVNLSFIFFRSPDLTSAFQMVHNLVPDAHALSTANFKTVRSMGLLVIVPPVIAGALASALWKNSDELAAAFQPTWRRALATAGMLLVSVLYLNSTITKQFVYFNF
jgi:alginate O-acetyltransferase complex protein AlgI